MKTIAILWATFIGIVVANDFHVENAQQLREVSKRAKPGDKIIREDDHGDPIYEDTGMTPRFLELVREHRRQLDNS